MHLKRRGISVKKRLTLQEIQRKQHLQYIVFVALTSNACILLNSLRCFLIPKTPLIQKFVELCYYYLCFVEMCLVAYQISFSSTCYCKCFYILHVHVHINWLLNQKINITRELTYANMRKFSKPMMYISATCLVSSKRNVSSTGYILC